MASVSNYTYTPYSDFDYGNTWQMRWRTDLSECGFTNGETSARIRLYFKHNFANAEWRVSSAWAGRRNPSGTHNLDYDGTQVQIKDGGSSTIASSSGGNWTDWTDYTELSYTDEFIIAILCTSGYQSNPRTYLSAATEVLQMGRSSDAPSSTTYTPGADTYTSFPTVGWEIEYAVDGSDGTPSDSPSAGTPSSSPSDSPSEGTPSPSDTPSSSPSDSTPSFSPSEGTPSVGTPPGEAIFDAGSTIDGTYTAGSVNFRYLWLASALTNTETVEVVQIKFFHGGTDYTIGACYIYTQASSGDAWDGAAGTGVEITQGGTTGIDVTSSNQISDPVSFSISTTDDVVIAINRIIEIVPYQSTFPVAGLGSWLKSSGGGFEAHLADVTGYNNQTTWTYIQEIQVGALPSSSPSSSPSEGTPSHGTPSSSPSHGTPSSSPSEATPSEGTPSSSPHAGYPFVYNRFDSLPTYWIANGSPTYEASVGTHFEANEWVTSTTELPETHEMWVAFILDDKYTPGTSDKIVIFKDNIGGEIGSVRFTSAGNIEAHHGGAWTDATRPTSSTFNFYWVQYRIDTDGSSNGRLRVWHNTHGIKATATQLINIIRGTGG